MKYFKTLEDAKSYMWQTVDNPCVDNERYAFLDNEEQCEAYIKQQAIGCCGGFDEIVKIDGRLAQIGCNYGH